MKKIFTIMVSVTFVYTLSYGQSQRLVLCEEYTQASCPPCAAQNPAYNDLLNANATKVVAIKYQVSWPGADPMNVHNPVQVATRVSYYAITGVPDGLFDAAHHSGPNYLGAPANATQTMINTAYAVPASFSIAVTFSVASNTIFANAHIVCTQATSTANTVAQMAVVERNIYFATAPGSNGETHFESVMKRMLPSDQGTAMPATWNVGDFQDVNLSWPLANVYDINQLAVVVFLQNNTTKALYQTGYARPNIVNDAGVVAVSGINSVTCATSINPVVTIHNFTGVALTSCNITYSIDGAPAVSTPWTGNIAADGSLVVSSLPTINLSNGSHSIIFSTTNPNGSADLDIHNDNTTVSVAVLANPVTAPLTQNFVLTTFPPAGWNRENVSGDSYTWVRSGTGLNGAGSAYMNCYNAAYGTVDNFYSPLVDFSTAIAGSTIEFDLAHAQYGAAYIEELKVSVSTDCGMSWNDEYDVYDPALASTPTIYTSAFTPTATQWRHETINLNSYIGQSSLLFRIQSTSGYGNNIYVDNININNGTVGIAQPTSASGIDVYPNPSSGVVNVNLNLNSAQYVLIKVFNSLGEVVATKEIGSTKGGLYPMNLSNLASGNYVVEVLSDKTSTINKITLNK